MTRAADRPAAAVRTKGKVYPRISQIAPIARIISKKNRTSLHDPDVTGRFAARYHHTRTICAICAICGCLSAAPAWAQATDQGGGASGGDNGGNGTGGNGGSGAGATGPVGPSLGQSFGQPLVPGGNASLLQTGPPQPGGIGSQGNLSLQPGQSLHDRIANALGLQSASVPGQPAWQITPSIGVQQGWTSNVFETPGGAPESAFFTILDPSLSVSANSQRVQGNLVYTPELIQYEPSRGQSVIAQNLSLQAHTILVPDTLFVNLSGFAGQQTITGGFGPTGTVIPNNSNTAQDYGFVATPYLQHRFGGFGLGEVGVSLTSSAQLIPGGSVVAAPQPGLPPTAIGSQIMNSVEEYLAFTSGEDFGRWLSNLQLSATQYGGTSEFVGAYANIASYEAGYAISHTVTALATIGWDDLYYTGIPPIHINTPLWNVGVQWTPNPDSQIVARYGRDDGIDAPYLSAIYMPTSRLRLTANYSVILSTDEQQLTSSLPNATTDASGNAVNAQTGQSLLQNNNFFGLLAGVYRLEQATVNASLIYDRDTFQVGFNQQRETALNTVVGGTVAADVGGSFGTLSWQHMFSDSLSASAMLQYGVTQSSYGTINSSGPMLVATATGTWRISDTFTATLQYTHTAASYGNSVAPFVDDMVIAGIQKSF
jgi:uncharacterized protein (PEP-CTERM system associated)